MNIKYFLVNFIKGDRFGEIALA